MSNESDEVELYCATCYEIWNERIKAWHDNSMRSPYQVGWVAATNLMACKDANEKQTHKNMIELTEIKWKRPDANFVKVNVDFTAFTSAKHWDRCNNQR